MKKVRLIPFLLILLMIAGLSSCFDEDVIYTDEYTTFGIRHDRDLSDYEDLAENPFVGMPDFSAVIAFEYSLDGSDELDYIASGTLIDAEWILTAGHNFYVADEQDEPAVPEGIWIYTGNDPNYPDQSYEVAELVFHPTWIEDNRDFLSANDLCLVRLARPVQGITPAKLYTSKTETLGSTVWFCGFGDYSRLAGQDPDILSLKHAIENILDRKNDGILSYLSDEVYTGGLLAFDFDSPSGDFNSLGDDEINSDEQVLGSGTSSPVALEYEGTTIQGDSGGPLFVKDGDTWKLAGVLSGGADQPIFDHTDSSYGDISVFIRVSTHIAWIQSVISK